MVVALLVFRRVEKPISRRTNVSSGTLLGELRLRIKLAFGEKTSSPRTELHGNVAEYR
jgi:hypothetical protein